MKILVINGPNLNMLGLRERELYGEGSYRDLVRFIKKSAKERGIKVKCLQTNSEGRMITAVQRARGRYDGIIINAGGYTHTSVALLDALKASEVTAAEVHITDINSREEFRRHSFVSMYAAVKICGKGFAGYADAMDALAELLRG